MENNEQILERNCICPICGHQASTLVQHIHNKHKLTTEEFKKQFPKAPLQSPWFIARTRKNNVISQEARKRLSEKMKNNNPMKNLDTRRRVSNTKKMLFKIDPVYRAKMLANKEKADNAIRVNKDGTFKVPGWGVSGKFYHIYFRSTNELKFLIWVNKQQKLHTVKSCIQEKFNGEIYYCDFKIDGIYYEIKDKTYAQDEREKKQLRVIEHMRSEGKQVEVLNKKSDIIRSISYYDIVDEWLKGSIQFAKNTEHYGLVRRLKNEHYKDSKNRV